MSLESLYQTLLRIARENPPTDRVPYAFEKRVMARLVLIRAQAVDPWLLFSQGLWRAVIPCCALTLMVLCWNLNQFGVGTDTGFNGADDLEVAVVDSIDLNESVEETQ